MRRGTLVLCTLGVGDVLLAQPLLEAVRASEGNRLVVLARAGSPASLARRLGLADLVIDYVARWPHRAWGGPVLATWIARQRFRVVLATTGLNPFYAAVMAWASGAPVRVGEDRGRFARAWTARVRVDPSSHMTVRNQALGRAVGVEAGLRPRLVPTSEERCRASRIVPDHPFLVGLAPGSNRTLAHKRWPVERFAELAKRLTARGAHVVVLGGPDERDLGARLGQASGAIGTDAVGATDVGSALAILSRCRVVIGNDGMLMHLAAAVDTPTVTVFGPSDPRLFAPVSPRGIVVRKPLPCSPCDHGRPGGCEDRPCLTDLGVDDVMHAVQEALEWGPPPQATPG